MSLLSPVAVGILGKLQSGLQGDAAAPAQDFLTLLEGGAAGSAAADPSLMDSLYRIAGQDPASLLNKTPVTKKMEGPDMAVVRAPAPLKERTTSSPRAETSQASSSESSAAPELLRKSVRNETGDTETSPVIRSGSDTRPDGGADEAEDPVVQLRGYLQDLNEILSVLASLFGAQQMVVQQQTVLSMELRGTLVSEQSWVDLSKRIDGLLAALGSTQNLPQDVAQPLSTTLGSFQLLLNQLALRQLQGQSLASGALALEGNTSSGVHEQLAVVQSHTELTLQAVQLRGPHLRDAAAMTEQLQKMNAWLEQLAGNMPDTLPEAQETASPLSLLQAATVAPTASFAADRAQTNLQTVVRASSDTLASVDAPVAAAPAAPTLQAPTVADPAQLAGNLLQAAVSAANASTNGGNSNSQGGERAPIMPVVTTSALAANTAAGASGSASFGATLKATRTTPAVAEQVVFHVKTAVRDGSSTIEIQLDPVELGKLRIKLDLSSDGRATGIVITAEHKETLALLQRDARGLEHALADAGIKADAGSLSFNLRGGDQGQGRDEAPKPAYHAYTAQEEEDVLAPLSVVSRHYMVSLQDGLDIQI